MEEIAWLNVFEHEGWGQERLCHLWDQIQSGVPCSKFAGISRCSRRGSRCKLGAQLGTRPSASAQSCCTPVMPALAQELLGICPNALFCFSLGRRRVTPAGVC